MKKTKILSFIMALTLVSGVFAGCQKKDDSAQSSSSKPDSSQGSSIASPSWKTDTSAHNVVWFLSYDWYGKKFNPQNNTFDKWIQDETGCSIEVQTGSFDKLNVLIQTNKLPDVVTTDASSSQRLMLENQKMVLPINELSKKYAPELHVPKSAADWYKAKDGNFYCLVNFYYGEDNTKENNGYLEVHNQNFARTDILKKIGMTLDDLRTKEGFIKALRAVKDQKINYNGLKMIPYAALIAEGAVEHVAYQFGASQETKDGKYISLYKTPEFLEALKFYNQLYTEGLMTDESFTMKKDQIQQKVASGQLFSTTVWSNVLGPRDSLYAADENAQMLYAGAMKGDTHDSVALPCDGSAGWAATMINKEAKKPDRVIQLLSFLTQKESVITHEYGVNGWKMGSDGKVILNEEMQKEKAKDAAAYSAKHGTDFPWLLDYTFTQGVIPAPKALMDIDFQKRVRDEKVTVYDGKCFAIAFEMGSDLAATETRINEYRKQEVAKIITAKPENVEKLYKAMIAEMDKMGFGKIEEACDKEFQANKQRLGIKFVHPFNK